MRMEMNKIILVEKYQSNSDFWSNFEKSMRFSKQVIHEMLSKYQGFEGVLKDICDIKNNDTDLRYLFELFLEIPTLDRYKFLYVGSIDKPSISKLPISAIKLGYEVGICIEECIFSSIMNEILFGRIPELVAFKDLLNENFLFSDKETAQRYVRMHNKMEEEGRGVEDHMTMEVHEIWKLG